MEIEKYLEKIKREYLKTKPSEGFEKGAWQKLAEELPEQERKMPISFIVRRTVLFAVILIAFIAFGMFTLMEIAQASLPGEPLYPVKRLYENIAFTKPSTKKIKVERRGQEIIDVVKKKKEKRVLEDSLKDYKKSIEEAWKKTSEKEEEELREVLEDHEKRFREIIEENSGSKDQIEKALETIRLERENGEVKGEKDEEEDKSGKGSGEDRKDEGREDEINIF